MAVLGLEFVVLGVMLVLGVLPICAFADIFEFSLFSTSLERTLVNNYKGHKHR